MFSKEELIALQSALGTHINSLPDDYFDDTMAARKMYSELKNKVDSLLTECK